MPTLSSDDVLRIVLDERTTTPTLDDGRDSDQHSGLRVADVASVTVKT